MPQVSPKQLQQAEARSGQALEWTGANWKPGENLQEMANVILVQDAAIRALVFTLAANGFDIPQEAQVYL